MFESIIVKGITPEKVTYDNPKFMYIEAYNSTDEDRTDFTICKGAETFLTKVMGIKPNTSKEVYKLSDDIWRQLKNKLLDDAANNLQSPFKLESENTLFFCSERGCLVDITEVHSDEELQNYKDKLDKYVLDITTNEYTNKFFTDSKDDTLKLVCYSKTADLVNDDYTPVVLLELNMEKSKFRGYAGILIYKEFTFVPAVEPFIDADRFSNFIRNFDLNNCLEYAIENGENIYNNYKQLLENDCEISVRELLNILNSVGYKLTLQDDNQIGEVKNLSDEHANMEIQNFFNTFNLVTNESAREIISLSELQKIFRYNKLTFMDVLKILSKEYLEYDGSKINAEKLNEIIFSLYSKYTDKIQAELIKKEIED